MDGFLLFVLSVGPIVGVTAGFAWAATRARRRGLGGSLVGPFQEMWDPGAARTRIEIEIRAEQRAPAPSPGDPPDTDGVRPDTDASRRVRAESEACEPGQSIP
ncbi:hypothetical protein [Nocardia amikacinitolerans]|uniref:hypothetical protein n=1 Tax=Nocardia amikacinitolerans TaxID=756689 RepID=UPI0015CCD08B|nr:hypothetical protein [Nocardia amikacinitolerans]